MNIDIGYVGMVLVAILLSMTLHEAMHGYAAYWLGDHTAQNEGRLTLNPVHHIDPFLTILLPLFLLRSLMRLSLVAPKVPFNPFAVRGGAYGAALVGSIAGPLTNLVLSFVLFALYALLGGPWGY